MERCNHTSVGILAWRNRKLLLIERKRGVLGFAPPAGHVNNDESFEDAAKRELFEEVGLKVKELELLTEGQRENHCFRTGGDWHYWKIYQAQATGRVHGCIAETKQVRYFSPDELAELARKTERYLNKEMTDSEWEASPGLEPVWYDWLQELHVI